MTERVGRSVLARPTRAPGVTTSTLDRLLERLGAEAFPASGTVVVGGGCAGLALALAVAEAGRPVAVVDARSGDRDGRTWCYWDTGEALLPEAVSRSWDRWEVRTPGRVVVASDPQHPYRMVRAGDYRAAARDRLAGAPGARMIERTRIVTDAARPLGRAVGPLVFDARGAAPASRAPAGRVLLHQRFVGRWIRTDRPVFDTSTVTLMDFPAAQPDRTVRFFYVLPVAADLALVECTVFSSDAHGDEPFQRLIAEYVAARWGLGDDEWAVEGGEAGSIPMTDASPEPVGPAGVLLGLRAGIARPSSGYAFTRIQIDARRRAAAARDGSAAGLRRDRLRVRILDAVFLRFLRDRPALAPAVFLRMFGRLPGPLVVRFLTERSGVLDDVRLILALPKAPFLRAAVVTAAERLAARRA